MLRFSKSVLQKVSFDKSLFRKELKKSITWVNPQDLLKLKVWCLATFSIHKDVVLEVFENAI